MQVLLGIDLGITGVKAALFAVEKACDCMVRIVEQTAPRSEVERVYAQMYDTYRAPYPALKSILNSPS